MSTDILTVVIIILLFPSVNSLSFETTRRLFNHLMENDTKYIRPVLNQFDPVVIDVTIRAYSLKMFDVTLERFSLLSTFVFEWKDEYKIWNASMYGGLRRIHLPKANMWVPNILIENSADLTAILKNDDSDFEVAVINNGQISVKVPAVFEVLCEPNIRKYPFDEHECEIVFLTDRLSTEIKLQATHPIDTSSMRDNAVWDVSSTSLVDNVDRKSISALTFHLIFKRYATFQVMNFVVPVIVLVVLNLLVFVLPPESGERVSYAITILLSFIVFISGITNQLPEANNPLCLFNVYLVIHVVYSALISTAVICVSWMFHRESDSKVPVALEYVFGDKKLDSCKKRVEVGNNEMKTPETIGTKKNDHVTGEKINWQTIARRVDRMLYYFFAVLAFVETVVIFLVIHFR